ncbi:MAG: hypothetical protein NVS1B9_05190 [Solirubrobacteraceae bacterium]
MSAANVDLARRGYEAVLHADLDAIRELLDPDVRWHGGDVSAPGACQNRDQALAFVRQARERGAIGELVDVVDAGEQVVIILRPPSPGAASLLANLISFRDGRVVEIVHYDDPQAALTAARAQTRSQD